MNSEEFYTKVKAFAKMNPHTMFIIESVPKEDHARQEKARIAWLGYLEANGLKSTASTWKAIWGGVGKAVTVPTEDPCIFDLSYHPDGRPSRRAYEPRWRPRDPSEPSTYRPE